MKNSHLRPDEAAHESRRDGKQWPAREPPQRSPRGLGGRRLGIILSSHKYSILKTLILQANLRLLRREPRHANAKAQHPEKRGDHRSRHPKHLTCMSRRMIWALANPPPQPKLHLRESGRVAFPGKAADRQPYHQSLRCLLQHRRYLPRCQLSLRARRCKILPTKH